MNTILIKTPINSLFWINWRNTNPQTLSISDKNNNRNPLQTNQSKELICHSTNKPNQTKPNQSKSKNPTNITIIIQAANQKQLERTETYPHLTLNFSKRLIKSPNLASRSLEEIRQHLQQESVPKLKRIFIRKETIIDKNV